MDKFLEVSFFEAPYLKSFNDFIGNTYGMWAIENEDMSTGGFIKYGEKFRLKHFSSGYYLSVKKKDRN